MRVLFISLEYLGPLFSGNGVYARCLVRGLKSRGATVLVLSGRKASVPMEAQDEEARAAAKLPHGIIDVPLSSWGSLDRSSCWREFETAAGSENIVARVADFNTDVVAIVDWSALPAWSALSNSAALKLKPLVFLNFRVFTTSTELHRDPEDARFYALMEQAAVRCSDISVALCRQDATTLGALALGTDPSGAALGDTEGECADRDSSQSLRGLLSGIAAREHRVKLPDVRVLLPPLRRDVEILARRRLAALAGAAPAEATRVWLTSVVRLSPEKRAHVYAALVEFLFKARAHNPDASATVYRPLVAGSRPDPAYADRVISDVLAAAPEAYVPAGFLDAAALGEAYERTRLNVHAALADAYGMTIVEAAAFGAPSVVHMPPACLPLDWGQNARHGHLRARLEDGGMEAPPITFDNVALYTGDGVSTFPGYLKMVWGNAAAPGAEGEGSLNADDARALGAAAIELPLPPVGACDLLLSPVLASSVVRESSSSARADVGDIEGKSDPAAAASRTVSTAMREAACFVPIDLTLPVDAIGAVLAPLLSTSGGCASLAAVGERAQRVALSWTEDGSAAALEQILTDAIHAASLRAARAQQQPLRHEETQ